MSQPRFIHLHCHSEYSIVDGLLRIEPLVERVAALGMPAIALTDQSALFSMVKLYRAACARGVKPIIGADLWLQERVDPSRRPRVVALCQNLTGYRTLTEIITRSYLEGQVEGQPEVSQSWLLGRSEGLILLSGGPAGDVGQALMGGAAEDARRRLERWCAGFPGRFYLELQRTGRAGDEEHIERALELARSHDVAVVATNDCCFLEAEDYEAHEARVCIHEGRTLADRHRARRYSPEQYLRAPEEMAALFADLPEAIENSVRIAERCNLELCLDRHRLPEFPAPAGTTVEELLRSQASTGLAQRLSTVAGAEALRARYEGRLTTELGVITKMGFAGYFLIVADFIGWAKRQGIPVGPGRGSGAGSLCAYALGITDLDPMYYDLLFERFLNPERVSLPDFDIDFCMDRRDEVIDYVAERYGRDRVAQIITYGSMAARAVVRDVGRVLGYPYGFVDQIAKLIPFALDMTLERALAEEPALKERHEAEEEVRTLIDLAAKLEGLVRNAGKHAGGVVIAPAPLTEFMPLYCEQGSTARVTQLDMGDVEAMGLVKFDFLGLRTLTIIDWAVRDINAERRVRGEPPLEIAHVPLDDPAAFDLIRRAETTAVFQLESRGIKDLLKRLRPDSFEDLIALVALFRPGPLQSGMVDDFIDRKHGRASVRYPHPALEPVLRPTYGVILYQEQVMQIAQVLAGYTLGAADLLRRAMGKKKPEEMAKQRAVFVAGAEARGVGAGLAASIFDLMEKFAGYGFNKSHSAAYALIAYQTAWLKARYPEAFTAAVLSADMDHTDKVVALVDECRRMGLALLPPDVNASGYGFAVAGPRAIRYGLGAVKGAGRTAIEALTMERDTHGPYRDLHDLCMRVDARKANRRVLEALIRAGALDPLAGGAGAAGRSGLIASLGAAMQAAEQSRTDHSTGQEDLFGAILTAPLPTAVSRSLEAVEAPAWTDEQRLAGEYETLGLYLSGHPIERYEPELPGLVSCRLSEITPGARRVAGLVVGIRHSNSRRGRMVIAALDDRTARIEAVVYPEVLRRTGDVIAKGCVVIAEGNCAIDELGGGYTLIAERVLGITEAREVYARELIVRVDASRMANGFVEALRRVLTPFRTGTCRVLIEYRSERASTRLRLSEEWSVRPADELLEGLGALVGRDGVCLDYAGPAG